MPICPHCGFEADPGSRACPLCGSGPLQHAQPGEGARAIPAWEDPGLPFGTRLATTWKESLFEPAAFFRRVGRSQSVSGPLLYYLLVTVVGAFFSMWWEAAGVWPPIWEGAPPGIAAEVGEPAAAVFRFFLSPFIALVGLAVWTLVLHLFVLLFVPERQPIGSTARALCYSAGPTVFAVVPFLGGLVALAWITVLQVIGLREVHETTTGRAAVVVLAPLAIVFLMVVFLVVLLAAGAALLETYA